MAYYDSAMSNVLNVYNFYRTSYAPKKSTAYDTHKQGELQETYRSIVQQSTDAPWYILDTSTDSQAFAVGMKENARELHNTIASLGGLDADELLNKKAAYSTDDNVVSATYIGTTAAGVNTPTVAINVHSLATKQVNDGLFLHENDSVHMPADTYSFDVNIDDLSYEFQFSVKSDDTNRTVQERLMRLVNNANIGLSAEVVAGKDDTASLQLSSNMTGLKNDKDVIFRISDDHTGKRSGAVAYFGLNNMTEAASNASFTVNGEERTSPSNTLPIGRMFEVTLQGVSKNESDETTIGLKTDTDSLTQNINTLVQGYNTFVRAAAEYEDSQPKSNMLVHEFENIPKHFAKGLTSAGLNLNLAGTIEIDEDALQKNVTSENVKETFSPLMDFTQTLVSKTNEVTLNPMNYVENKIVAYKNPGKNFPSPYVTSAYSGMMFNSYC